MKRQKKQKIDESKLNIEQLMNVNRKAFDEHRKKYPYSTMIELELLRYNRVKVWDFQNRAKKFGGWNQSTLCHYIFADIIYN